MSEVQKTFLIHNMSIKILYMMIEKIPHKNTPDYSVVSPGPAFLKLKEYLKLRYRRSAINKNFYDPLNLLKICILEENCDNS